MSVITTEPLLTREQFREQVFTRDGHKCVFCGADAVDAHHILERRLWGPSQGYYLSNGASVCEEHHLECEMTRIAVEEVREACGIRKWSLPDHMYDDCVYDKWGNIILPNGQRMMGELFLDESVQKILGRGGVLDQFTNRVKYQRTFHVPDSPGMHKDDRVLPNYDDFTGHDCVILLKMDGENTTCYRDYIHARSIDGRSHPSRDWVKQFHSTFASGMPDTFRICGENLYAEHSIHYNDLLSYFAGFQIWDQLTCLSYDETLEYFELFGIWPVPELWRGSFTREALLEVVSGLDLTKDEGVVIRRTDSFHYSEFRRRVAKWVRPGHIQTTKHWMHGQPMVRNEMRKV